jgi:magnesium transporter
MWKRKILGLDKLVINPLKKISKKINSPPGTITFLEEPKISEVSVYLIDYGEENLKEIEITDIDEINKYKDSNSVTWIKIVGLSDLELLQKIGIKFKLHPLVLEDICHTTHRPKLDEYDKYLFLIARSLRYLTDKEQVLTEQVSMIVGSNYVITFQEHDDHLFDNIINRIKSAKGRIRKRGADFLTYAILDALVDHYLIILEKLGDDIEVIQSKLISKPNKELFQVVHQLREEILVVRKAIFPLREIIKQLQNEEISFMREETAPFLRDVHDHMILALESIDEFRETVRTMFDLYFSSLSNQMNDVMRVLTIIATIFIPLTFIAGIYGMNFKFMPELDWRGGYFTAVGVMSAIAIVMLIYFKKKKWF